ncbi:hypothetical protein PAXRUDRAFT_824773 [Paxillus rubicundulus Ve08.2h10]|uniref:Uncharacterized protein n=1 Tax=Paxillus rubicundulus Ve08.2h10 TaxID=930991 RepID=A0A0D0EBH1_9AGAM|nr:hypothetical protein PAXRUDRAFT_824773 [Paxillus rubicundulus Ve08.2h10]
MAPRTRNATKHSSPTKYPSPGRSTRNSLYGRPPLPPPKPRNSAHGVSTSVVASKTRRCMDVRWYNGDEEEAGEDQDTGVDMDVDGDVERDVTPAAIAGPSNHPQCQVLQTPIQLHSFDAGSVIRTPIKKAKPLQASPTRIGEKGINCLYEQGGAIRERNGAVRVMLPHALGSSANLSRDQVERLENEQESRIFHEQMKKLLAQKKQRRSSCTATCPHRRHERYDHHQPERSRRGYAEGPADADKGTTYYQRAKRGDAGS